MVRLLAEWFNYFAICTLMLNGELKT